MPRAGRSRNRAAARPVLVRRVDLHPLYQRSRAPYMRNAPHIPGGRGRRTRAAGLLSNVGERRRSSSRALADSPDQAATLSRRNTFSKPFAVDGEESRGISLGARLRLAARFAKTGADAFGGGARSSTRA